MTFKILADFVVGLHFLFIVFVLAGGLLALRWPKIAWVHVPSFVWGASTALFGWICPLTYLENDFRARGMEAGYDGGFIEAYILPLIYPELLFPAGFPREGFIAIGVFVLGLNALIYWRVIHEARKRKPESGT